MPTPGKSGAGVLNAVSAVIEAATSVQKEITSDVDRNWVASQGPIVSSPQEGALYVHRAVQEWIGALRARKSPEVLARLLIDLSGAAMKIGMDMQVLHELAESGALLPEGFLLTEGEFD